jgi:hypothetical protein
MIAIGAMSLFMTLGWNALGGWGGFFTAVCYCVLALARTHWFIERKHLAIPAGIMATLAVVMVPLAVFGAQMALGSWDDSKPYRDYHVFIDWRWIVMEFATLAIGALLLWRYRFPFMLMPIAVTLWYMSMDLVPFLFGDWRDWEIRSSSRSGSGWQWCSSRSGSTSVRGIRATTRSGFISSACSRSGAGSPSWTRAANGGSLPTAASMSR